MFGLAEMAGLTSPPAAEPSKPEPALQPFVDNHLIAGAVVLVADATRALDVEAIGSKDPADKTPMRPDSMLWIASMTKPVAARR